jgi:hypothetical protein
MVVAATMSFAVVPSWAGDPEAATFTKQGVERFKHEDYEGAAQAFSEAYLRDPSTAALLDLALAELRAGRHLSAVRHFRSYLLAPDATPDRKDIVRSKLLPEGEARITRLRIDAPAGAEVAVDGDRPQQAPVREPLDVSAGSHNVFAHFGTWSEVRHLETGLGQVVEVRFDLPPAPAPNVAVPPSPPRPDTPVAAPEKRPATTATGRWITVVSLGAAALAATGVGVGFHVANQNEDASAAAIRSAMPAGACAGSSPASTCGSLFDALNRSTEDSGIAVGFFAGGAALALSAVVTWLLWPKPEARPKAAWWVQLYGLPQGAGASVGQAF